MHDVVVVGGGPGGLHAARRLASRGADVTLLEEHDTCGTPVHCTGILARDAFDEFGLSRASILNEVTTARFVSPQGTDLVHRTRLVEAVVIDRARFDHELALDAARCGATLRFGTRVRGITIGADHVQVDVGSDASIRARACVLATGGRYALHRPLGLGLPDHYLHTAQREVPAARPGVVEVHFGREVAPGGFGWVVPVWRGDRAYARVGVMAESRAPEHFVRMLDRVGERWGLDAGTEPPRQKILPLSLIARTFGDRLLVVGDAAGLVKPTTGGGIYYSLLSAGLAADVLVPALADGDLSARRLADYQRRWKAQLKNELDTQSSFRKLAQKMSDTDIESLFELARTDGVMPIVRKTASFNRHRRLILALLRHQPARQIFFRSFVS
jgi:digeranylgeranylglycerophospholipid reductase